MTKTKYSSTVKMMIMSILILVSSYSKTQEKSTDLEFIRVNTGDFIANIASSASASWIDIDSDGFDDLYVLNGYGSLENPPIAQGNFLLITNFHVLSFILKPELITIIMPRKNITMP